MESERYVSGMVVSADPIVTYSKRSTGMPLGIASARPDLFRDRKALHLVGLSHSIERDDACNVMARDVDALARALPESRFVVLTNSEFEAYLLSQRGVASMMSSQLIFLNENIFRPQQTAPRFDAIYNGRLMPVKRHELARGIANLGLLYDLGPPDEPPLYDEVRAQLPHAVFINHEKGQGAYRQLKIEECAEELNAARVGLCLSAVEGAMQAALEYMLCGLPVVSTHSIGGRDRYFMPPFCRIVDADADQVASAVKAFVGARIPKQAVRNFIMHLVTFDRHNFLLAVNRLVKDTFGVDEFFRSFAPFEVGLTRWRRAEEAVAPLAAAT
jgi:glycosyltransferase involved in cell wall biosynthesis